MNAPNTLREGDGVWVVTNPKGETLTITLHEVLRDTAHELGVDPGLQKDGVEAHLQELLAATPTPSRPASRSCVASTRRRSARSTCCAATPTVRSSRSRSSAAARSTASSSSPATSSAWSLDSSLGTVRGMFVAQMVEPQARVLAEVARLPVGRGRLRPAARARPDELTLF